MILKLLVMYARKVWGITPATPDANDFMWYVVCYFGLMLDIAVIGVAVWLWHTMRKD